MPDDALDNSRFSELWLAVEGEAPLFLAFRDRLRRDAVEVCDWLKKDGLDLILLSGDREDVVRETAAELGIDNWRAGFKPQEKIAVLEELKAKGKKPLMVGDGLNDAPALAAAYVSISPSSAADVSQNAADFIFQSQKLETVVRALQVSPQEPHPGLCQFRLCRRL